MMSPRDRIRRFWAWFKANHGSFGPRFENAGLIDLLDQNVRSLGPVGWELGPGWKDPAHSSLTISPRGDPQTLPLTRAIVAEAPDCAGWEFYAAKPPKTWTRKVVLTDSRGIDVLIDASKWSYQFLRYPDGILDVVFRAPDAAALDEDLRFAAATIVLDGEIGEEARLTKVNAAEIVRAFENGGEGVDIVHLREHFREMAS